MSGLLETTGLPEVPLRLLIGGEWCEAASGKRFATLNPANEQVLAEVSEADLPEIDAAVSAARDAVRRGAWPAMTAPNEDAFFIGSPVSCGRDQKKWCFSKASTQASHWPPPGEWTCRRQSTASNIMRAGPTRSPERSCRRGGTP